MRIRTKEKSSCPHLELQSCVQFSKSAEKISLERGKTMNKLLLVSTILLASIGFCEDGLQERILIEFTSTGVHVIEEEMGNAATKEMIQSANRGDADSQFQLAKCYYYGNGVETNYAEAAKWFRRSAEQGHVEAQFDIGTMNADGKGVAKNWIEAEQWFRKAAEQDFPQAQLDLCMMYAEGVGVDKNQAEAEKWFNKIAERSESLVNQDCWTYYSFFNSKRYEYPKSIEWLRYGANRGSMWAQYYLAKRNAKGDGVVTNYIEAVKWYKASAEQGHHGAQKALGEIYAEGKGVEVDLGEGIDE